ncbi:YitT family protein [Effusibacillus consociatus]|uniref:YitT family protein n=1 Tax=Effusibacillus consociatus TaxID=1117041 RepID=A0ABV9Q2S3_9BACL
MIKKCLTIFGAIVFFAVGNLLFAVPNRIMNGGVTGLSQIGYYLFGFNIGFGIFLLNLPLFILAFLFYRNLFYNSILCMAASSLVIGVLQEPLLRFGIHNIWVGSIAGGFWMGITLGFLARRNASLGGGSLLAKMLHQRYGFSLSKLIFLLDCSVFPLSLFLIGAYETLFSLILTACSSLGVYAADRILQFRSGNVKLEESL